MAKRSTPSGRRAPKRPGKPGPKRPGATGAKRTAKRPRASAAKRPRASAAKRPRASAAKRAVKRPGTTKPAKRASTSRTERVAARPSTQPARSRRGPGAPRSAAQPSPLTAALARANDRMRRGDWSAAADALLAAAELDPTNWRLPNEAGVCLFRAHRYDDALVCYDRALLAIPDRVTVLTNRAFALLYATRVEEALENFKLALEADPSHPLAHLEIGKIHQDRARYPQALAAFDAALQHNADGTQIPDRALAVTALLCKARILLGPMDREDDGLAQVHLLWSVYDDGAAIVKLAQELADTSRDRAVRVLDVLLAAVPDHVDALTLRAALTS